MAQESANLIAHGLWSEDEDRDLSAPGIGSQIGDGLRKGPANDICLHGNENDIRLPHRQLKSFAPRRGRNRFKADLIEQAGHLVALFAVRVDHNGEGRLRSGDRPRQDLDDPLRRGRASRDYSAGWRRPERIAPPYLDR